MYQSCRFIMSRIALLSNSLSCKVDNCRVWVNFEWMSRQWNQISLICVGRQQNRFFQLHTVVKLFFNDITLLKPGTDTNFNQKTTWGVLWRAQGLISTNLWNKLSDKTLIEICECGRWTEFAKTSVCIILIVLVYLESANVYTGPKIVCVLKRLRNTELNASFANIKC